MEEKRGRIGWWELSVSSVSWEINRNKDKKVESIRKEESNRLGEEIGIGTVGRV